MLRKRNLLPAGSVDRRLATCAAEASNPCKSSGASSEISCASNPALIEISLSIKKITSYSSNMKAEIQRLLFRIGLLLIHNVQIHCLQCHELRKYYRVRKNILQAVQGNPPNKETGRVGAVGQIHFTCSSK